MAGNFEDMWPIIKAHEVGPTKNGGLVDNPADPGGLTKWGVSILFLEKIWPLVKAFGVTLSFPVPETNDALRLFIVGMTEEQAKEIYLKCWWDFFKFERINEAKVAYKICDIAINMGPPNTKGAGRGKAFELTQQALVKLGKNAWVNGLFTPYDVGLINECDADELLRQICREQAQRYRDIVAKNPSQSVFLKGWLARAAWPFKVVP